MSKKERASRQRAGKSRHKAVLVRSVVDVRDYLAAHALISATIADSISRIQADQDGSESERVGADAADLARYAYNQADAMIAARDRSEG